MLGGSGSGQSVQYVLFISAVAAERRINKSFAGGKKVQVCPT